MYTNDNSSIDATEKQKALTVLMHLSDKELVDFIRTTVYARLIRYEEITVDDILHENFHSTSLEKVLKIYLAIRDC